MSGRGYAHENDTTIVFVELNLSDEPEVERYLKGIAETYGFRYNPLIGVSSASDPEIVGYLAGEAERRRCGPTEVGVELMRVGYEQMKSRVGPGDLPPGQAGIELLRMGFDEMFSGATGRMYGELGIEEGEE